ncbi:hypothetical protein [Mycobacterium simiae]|uniref:hypothetical protein n=1 Tax=Mycobacterium simiae TaxID=1784 RepID=UPI002604D9B6|nr:hypothetical protein [Mycobacterium simiae]
MWVPGSEGAVKRLQGLEAALWRVLVDRWLERDTTIPVRMLGWLVHDAPPTPTGVDIAWPPHPT